MKPLIAIYLVNFITFVFMASLPFFQWLSFALTCIYTCIKIIQHFTNKPKPKNGNK